MVTTVRSMGLQGIGGYPVRVECSLSNGLPHFDVVGLPDAAVKEARERVRAAIRCLGLHFPATRLTVNLAPADTKKNGTLYDLPILLGILVCCGALRPLPQDAAFLGELGLTGELRPVRGALPMALAAARREFTAAEKAAEEIKPYVLRRYITGTDAETLWVRITALEEQLNELYAQAQAGIGSVSAPVSGWFSAESDGLEERLTPAFLENCYISDLEEAQAAAGQDSGALCKLVTSQKWYFAAIVPAQNVRDLKEGSRVQVSFAYDFDAPLRMKVERISSPEEERCILVLSSEAYIQNAVSSRIQTADLVFADRVGLRVPKTALYVNEAGERGVYVLEGAEAQWKVIELLYDNGDSYIVKLDKSSTKNLWPEDEIILTTEDIYDGKVMIK